MESINLLKDEVKKIFGRRILSSADCQNLCDDIERTSSVKISFNTIRRFFNLMKAANHPSAFTLNALSNYCGFSSYDDFIIAKQPGIISKEIKQEEILLNFLTLFFRQIEVGRRNDITYLSLVHQTILHLDHHPAIIDRLQKEIAKTKNGQRFYFEQFVFIDKLNSYYGSGLQYYLNEKKTKEAQVFGHALLCYGSWLAENKEGVQKHYKEVMQYNPDKSMSYSVCARYFTTQLYYANISGADEEPVLLKIKEFYSGMKECRENYSYFNCFEVILAEALILVARYDEAFFYINEVLKKVKRNIRAYIDVALCENICLLKAIVLAQTGKKWKAYAIIQDINPYKFSFLSSQYLNILYFSIKQIFKDKAEEQEQIQHLIEVTGFVRLSSVCKNASKLANKD